MQKANTTEKEKLIGDEDEECEDEELGTSRRSTDASPKPIRDPFGDVELSPITAQEVEAAVPTPDESSDGDFEVLVEVDRVTPIKSPGDIQVDVDSASRL